MCIAVGLMHTVVKLYQAIFVKVAESAKPPTVFKYLPVMSPHCLGFRDISVFRGYPSYVSCFIGGLNHSRLS